MVATIAEVPANCLNNTPSLTIRDVQGGVGPYLSRTSAGGALRQVRAFPETFPVEVGRTSLQIEDVNGCLLEESFELAGPPESEVTVSPARSTITLGDSVELRMMTGLDVTGFRLSPGPDSLIFGNSTFVRPLETTSYDIFVLDAAGCSASTQVEVIVEAFVPVYSPTAFSPNGDGRNDVFRLFARSTVVSLRNFQIFNRWGDMVYFLDGPIDPQDTNWGWDGRDENGEIHEPAVYVYSIEVELADGRVITLKSDMVLMR
jgi:gliding motility-associated-like protein